MAETEKAPGLTVSPASSGIVPPIPIKRGPGRPKANPETPKPAPLPKRSNEEWQTEVANAWLGLWVLIKLIAGLFGFQESGPLTEEEARQDAIALTPVVQRYPVLTRFVSWIAAPIVILNRVRTKFVKKPKTGKPNAETLRNEASQGKA